MSRFHISTIGEMTHIAKATSLPSNPKKPKETGTPDSKRNAGNTIYRITTVSATLIKNPPFPLQSRRFMTSSISTGAHCKTRSVMQFVPEDARKERNRSRVKGEGPFCAANGNRYA